MFFLRRRFIESFPGHAGRPGLVGGSAPSPAGIAAKDILGPSGGASVNVQGEKPTSGYMVGQEQFEKSLDFSQRPSYRKLRETIAAYQQTNAAELSGPIRYIGGWLNEHDRLFLDCAINLQERRLAFAFGYHENQYSIYNVNTKETHTTMSDGERPRESKGERIREARTTVRDVTHLKTAQEDAEKWKHMKFFRGDTDPGEIAQALLDNQPKPD